ncbi:BTB/POZ domain-containing protein At2g30600 isoform X2 [Dioscorea cayenensis subsp. rotundata]|uniref:BTB/POZ domain-containing protein At2g30600 isoform X2 n=1 Tax=Dioscorea cayennensis subsp. rotundata TaxID=55577 RepID=A0AB40CLM1_DIOCR|nr:BTB/POZ domain-containing protein At2g30600 isoform X2 [Dioscorea cayenensis subsp. rotundata]
MHLFLCSIIVTLNGSGPTIAISQFLIRKMGGEKHKRFLTVAPFECAWREELRFREAGRGCIAFEAFAHNDVTLVFREQVGSQHYHYKMDNSPNYTVILGSHRNRRLKIEVDGKPVVDVEGVGLCCSSSFQSYWVSVYDGLISIGRGRYPFQNLVFQWLDSKPNCNVQYVGLSSWDKHVGYRNINVLPLTQHHHSLWNQIDFKEYQEENDSDEDRVDLADEFAEWGLANFLENWDFSDIYFVVDGNTKAIPAHKVILGASGDLLFSYTDENIIRLPSTTYPVLHAFLEYIYVGRTNIVESQLSPLRDLSLKFQVLSLTKKCDEIIGRFKTNKKLFDSGTKVEITCSGSQVQQHAILPHELPIDVPKLKQFFVTHQHSDLNIYIEGHGFIAKSHKIILSLWSVPFAKMLSNGMMESNSSDVSFSDVSAEAFLVMLQFMYSGELMVDLVEVSSLIIPLLLLADQFSIMPLQRECCRCILEYLTEDSVCPILQAVSSIASYKLLEETCKQKFSMHFDYCTTASTEFVLLCEETFKDILQHADLTVTSEEKVLDAILLWCMQSPEICGWAAIDELLMSSTPEQVFKGRLPLIDIFLPYVRFPLMPLQLLQMLNESKLCSVFPIFDQLVMEAINFAAIGMTTPVNNQNVRFQHRRSSFKELQYICDGDNNGVIYFAGTSYGEHQWLNPVLSKKINVTASSPASRYTDSKALVSRTYQATLFAGPRIEDGRTCAWWMIDIGQDHQLMCNYYTLRQDGSNAYPRSWALQGSMDKENWTNLRVHENDQTICRRGQFASWPIQGPSSLLPFRFFRVFLMGPTTEGSTSWNLCMCFIELYGYFH